ncbi:ABC transporter permease [Mycolicibacterium sp. 050158]|uniref:ABC transporter permease n=1 Tax=Mycolicibacterium sp. 050158 TaxID=3090602 RepID=UPI00299E61FD|nr:ABC transporter permease subunit [Mycolicibacterium sp. 050158]MDX1888114.1 ABC transporter permease subunit [Mycolicibacterium sp. 050158]
MTSTAPIGLTAAKGVVDQRAPTEPATGRRTRWVANSLVNTLWPTVAVIGAWALWVQLGDVPPAVAPHPSAVLQYLVGNAGSFVGDTWSTIEVVVGGLLIGTLAGLLLAALSWFSDILRAMINGPALLTQCLPVATITPVLARVFGYGTNTMVVITALISFFPVLVFATAGVRRTPAGSDDLFVVLGASLWQRFWRLAAPAAIPRILVALRLSVVAAVAGTMLAQWIMGTSGLGSRLIVAQSSFRTAEAWAAALVSIALSVLLYAAISAIGRRASERFD